MTKGNDQSKQLSLEFQEKRESRFGKLYYICGNWICENRSYNQRHINAMREKDERRENSKRQEGN